MAEERVANPPATLPADTHPADTPSADTPSAGTPAAPAEKPAPALRERPASSGGPGGRRMRARLARMATKSQSENPVLEPLFRAVR